MIEKEKLDDNKNNQKVNFSKDNNNTNNNQKEKEGRKTLENVDVNKMINKDEDMNSSFFDEKDDIKNSNNIEFKVILLGDSYVGKTTIIKKFISGVFDEKIQCTIKVEFTTKNLKIDKNLYAKLTIFDTAGEEKYRSLAKSYYRDIDGIILVFDLTDENSLNNITKWISEINENAENVEIILVGNKTDLKDRKVNKIQAENFAKENNFKYIETSAKDGTNVLLLFEELAIAMSKRKQEESSVVEMKNSNTYIFMRSELNKQLKNQKDSKCC